MPVFDLAVKGGPRASGKLRQLGQNLGNLSAESLTKDVWETLENWQLRVFETAGKAAGQSWPNYTRKESTYVGFKFQTLLENGLTSPDPPLLRWARGRERLWPSLTGRGSGKKSDEVREELSDGWEFGTAVPYAAKHQYGQGTAPDAWGGYSIPKRTFLNVTPKVASDLKDVLLDFVKP